MKSFLNSSFFLNCIHFCCGLLGFDTRARCCEMQLLWHLMMRLEGGDGTGEDQGVKTAHTLSPWGPEEQPPGSPREGPSKPESPQGPREAKTGQTRTFWGWGSSGSPQRHPGPSSGGSCPVGVTTQALGSRKCQLPPLFYETMTPRDLPCSLCLVASFQGKPSRVWPACWPQGLSWGGGAGVSP